MNVNERIAADARLTSEIVEEGCKNLTRHRESKDMSRMKHTAKSRSKLFHSAAEAWMSAIYALGYEYMHAHSLSLSILALIGCFGSVSKETVFVVLVTATLVANIASTNIIMIGDYDLLLVCRHFREFRRRLVMGERIRSGRGRIGVIADSAGGGGISPNVSLSLGIVTSVLAIVLSMLVAHRLPGIDTRY